MIKFSFKPCVLFIWPIYSKGISEGLWAYLREIAFNNILIASNPIHNNNEKMGMGLVYMRNHPYYKRMTPIGERGESF